MVVAATHLGAARNLTAYDAAYVSLAERLDSPLITCDGKLAGVSGPRCAFDLIT